MQIAGRMRWLIHACAVACFATAAHSAELLHAQGHIFRWGPGPSGTPQTVTYALVTDRYSVPGGKSIVSPDNCGEMRAFSEIAANSPAVPQAQVIAQLQAAFAQWQVVAGIKFVAVADPALANIVIGATEHTTGRAFANLSYSSNANLAPAGKALGRSKALGRLDEPAAFPAASADTIVQIEQAYVCLNPAARWKIGFDGNLHVYDLKYTFTHEIGHAIGLDHPGGTGGVMGYRYDEASPNLRDGDIAAVRSLYGRHMPPDTSPSEVVSGE